MDNGFSELDTMFGAGVGETMEKKIPIPVYWIIIAIATIVVVFFIMLLVIYLMKNGDSFKGKLPISAKNAKVSSARMQQQNSFPIHRYRGDASDGPKMPSLADMVTENQDIDNLYNPTLMDFEYDADYDMYKKTNEYGFTGDNSVGYYPIHPIKPEYPDQPIFHQNRLENVLYHT